MLQNIKWSVALKRKFRKSFRKEDFNGTTLRVMCFAQIRSLEKVKTLSYRSARRLRLYVCRLEKWWYLREARKLMKSKRFYEEEV